MPKITVNGARKRFKMSPALLFTTAIGGAITPCQVFANPISQTAAGDLVIGSAAAPVTASTEDNDIPAISGISIGGNVTIFSANATHAGESDGQGIFADAPKGTATIISDVVTVMNSTAIVVDSAQSILINSRTIEGIGADSAGMRALAVSRESDEVLTGINDGPVTIVSGSVQAAEGIAVAGNGRIDVRSGSVSTTDNEKASLLIYSGAGNADIESGTIVTSGLEAIGLAVSHQVEFDDAFAQTLTAGTGTLTINSSSINATHDGSIGLLTEHLGDTSISSKEIYSAWDGDAIVAYTVLESDDEVVADRGGSLSIASGAVFAQGGDGISAATGSGALTVLSERVDIEALSEDGRNHVAIDTGSVSGSITIRSQAILVNSSGVAEDDDGDIAAIRANSDSGNVFVDSGSILTNAAGRSGIHVDTGGGIQLNSGTIETTGARSHGIVLDSDDTRVSGSAVTISSGEITTRGADSSGMLLVDIEGPTAITSGKIVVSGERSTGITLFGSGSASLNVGSISATADAINIRSTDGGIAIEASAMVMSSGGAGIVLDGGKVSLNIGSESQVFGNTQAVSIIARESSTLDNAGAISSESGLAITANGPLAIRNSGTITGLVNFGGSNDRIENYGSINGDVNLGAGDDAFVQGINATFTGRADGGTGSDVLNIDTSGGGRVDETLLARFVNFEIFALVGDGATEIETGDGNDSFDNSGTVTKANLGEGNNSFTNSGTVQGDVTASSGSDRLVNVNRGTISGGVSLGGGTDLLDNRGTISGPVDFGDGADTLLLSGEGTFGGAVRGGAGTDTALLQTTGTGTAPTEVSFEGVREFEILRNVSGTTAILGEANFQRVDVTAGRLIGRMGSTLRGDVAVANTATFGSAGTVVGNVTVASGGTLSPGASPGTMKVQGDVALASGSAMVFEFTPAVSDQLLVSGNLSVASGTTINIVGERPLTPGTAYDLIVADGGISGSFTTTNKAASVFGFLRQTDTRLQLLGTFVTPLGTSSQAGAAIDYVNGVLVSGNGSAALFTAIPSLLSPDGTANTAAFSQLTPEVYATAQQLGVEQGLSIAKAGRAGATASPLAEPGAFSFAQGLGNWRKLRGDATTGASAARTESYGVLGGLGFGDQSASVGAFIGYLDGEQRFRSLDAKTTTKGIFAGVAGHMQAEAFSLSMLLAHDWSDADTRRTVPGATARSNEYGLKSLILDVSVGYKVPLSTGWAARPEAGITHIRTRRGRVSESGSSAFALDIDRTQASATFIDGAIGLHGGQKPDAKFHPWVEVGARHQLSGGVMTAQGGFTGLTSRFSVAGAARRQTVATVGVGASIDLMPNLNLFGTYLGEFGDSARSNNVNLGVRFAF